MDVLEYRRDGAEDGVEEVYSKSVRAGRRTYFFDVKATRNDDYYLTITESRKKQGKDGNFSFEKHKIYLYKEDFEKFAGGLREVVDFIRKNKAEFFNPDGSCITANYATADMALASIDEEFDSL
jgi:hypothetical protein